MNNNIRLVRYENERNITLGFPQRHFSHFKYFIPRYKDAEIYFSFQKIDGIWYDYKTRKKCSKKLQMKIEELLYDHTNNRNRPSPRN